HDVTACPLWSGARGVPTGALSADERPGQRDLEETARLAQAHAELTARARHGPAEPAPVLPPRADQPEPLAPHGHEREPEPAAGRPVPGGAVQQAQLGAEGLLAADALVVVHEVAAAVQDGHALHDLDAERVVRRVPVDQVD